MPSWPIDPPPCDAVVLLGTGHAPLQQSKCVKQGKEQELPEACLSTELACSRRLAMAPR